MIALLGRMASGKSTLAKMLEDNGFKRIVTYTTRPIGEGEVNHVDYHFIDEEEFIRLREEGFFAETKSYDTEYGVWYYGSSKESYNCDNGLIVIDPIGFRQLKEAGIDLISILIKVKTIDSFNKALERNRNTEDEIRRRVLADTIDFKGIESEVSIVVDNSGFKYSKDEMLNIIISLDKKGISKL